MQGILSRTVQKQATRRRGRPRAYDPERALDAAMAAFWRSGYAGTSLDDLTASAAMNRPSLYAAFGDKQALYLKTIERYRAASSAALGQALAADRPLAESLRAIYRGALDLYQAGEANPRGCYLAGTATTAALDDPEVRAALLAAHQAFDRAFAARFAAAREAGELPRDADPELLGSLAAGVIHTLAIRARAGESRRRLEQIADAAVAQLCGAAPRARPARRVRKR
ncbi:MAG TPA: TetR/AcrR family transcriptional regulator [Kofleriaceae bacterium]